MAPATVLLVLGQDDAAALQRVLTAPPIAGLTEGDTEAAAAVLATVVQLRRQLAQPEAATDSPHPGELCSCGRPAVLVYLTEQFGRVGYCGIPNAKPLPGAPSHPEGAIQL